MVLPSNKHFQNFIWLPEWTISLENNQANPKSLKKRRHNFCPRFSSILAVDHLHTPLICSFLQIFQMKSFTETLPELKLVFMDNLYWLEDAISSLKPFEGASCQSLYVHSMMSLVKNHACDLSVSKALEKKVSSEMTSLVCLLVHSYTPWESLHVTRLWPHTILCCFCAC